MDQVIPTYVWFSDVRNSSKYVLTYLIFFSVQNKGCSCRSRNGDISDCGCYTVPGLPQGSCQTEINFPCAGSGSGTGGQVGGVFAEVGYAPADVNIQTPVKPQKPGLFNVREKLFSRRQ